MNIRGQQAWLPRKEEKAYLAFSLPLVSVVVVNYNYDRFLPQAIESIFRQTYPAIECIIVDDASTDDSRMVIQKILQDHPDVTALFRRQNGGQSLASIDGLQASSGHYVVFLDADDFLLPAAIETHVYVHLSLRIPVGFTSGDMLQNIDGQTVLGTRQCVSGYVSSGKGRRWNLFRPINKALGKLYPLQALDDLESQLHFVDAASACWVWSPMSGNCYRRDALRLVFDNPALSKLTRSTDAYLNLGINVLTGSVLIDQPLAVYRVHGANGLSQHPQLNGFFSFKRRRGPDNPQLGRLLLLDHFMERADDLIRRSTAQHFAAAIVELGRHASFHGAPFCLSSRIWKNWKALREHFSFFELSGLLLSLVRRKI